MPELRSTLADGSRISAHRRWDKVNSDIVLEFLRSYKAINNVCFDELSDGSTMIAKFIEGIRAKGELSEWTVAVFQSATAEPAIPGKPYGLVGRKISNNPQTEKTVEFRGVAMGQDEALDLSESELSRANDAISKAKAAGLRTNRAALYRMFRPKPRGLLLVYPIKPTFPESGTACQLETLPVGIALSLPSSSLDAGIEYVCNTQKLRELYGSEFMDDSDRDIEEASTTNGVPAQ
jgi:hypothetical protein